MRFLRRRIKPGIALSGGAARALCHIGVLEVLEGLGVKPGAIAGTSMGAIIGSFYCAGVTLEEMKSYIKSMNWKSFLLFSDLVLSRTGIINGKKIENILRMFLGDKTFKDCRIPFSCVAVDLIKREKVVLSEGKLVDAVRASISIPGFFSAVYMDNKLLVDGGIIEPLPVESLKTMDVNFVIASSTDFQKNIEEYSGILEENSINTGPGRQGLLLKEKDNSKKGSGKFFNIRKSEKLEKEVTEKLSVNKILDTTFSIIHQELIKNHLKSADIVIEPEVGDFGYFDLMRGSRIIQRGVEAAQEKIPEIKRKLHIK